MVDIEEHSSVQNTAQGQRLNQRLLTSNCFVRDAQNLTFTLKQLNENGKDINERAEGGNGALVLYLP